MIACTYCNRPLEPANAYQRLVAWEKKGVGGSRKGGSDVVLREHREQFACSSCIERQRLGLSVAQESMSL